MAAAAGATDGKGVGVWGQEEIEKEMVEMDRPNLLRSLGVEFD